MKKILGTVLVLFLLVTSQVSIAANKAIGLVLMVRGEFTATAPNGVTRTLKRRDPVYQGDVLKTGKNSRGQVRFRDDSFVLVQASSSISLDQYTYSEASPQNSKSSFSLVEGGFRALTGKIANQNPENYRVVTEVAVVGVRGTYFGAYTCSQGSFSALCNLEQNIKRRFFYGVWPDPRGIVNSGIVVDFYDRYKDADGKRIITVEQKPFIMVEETTDGQLKVTNLPKQPNVFEPVATVKRDDGASSATGGSDSSGDGSGSDSDGSDSDGSGSDGSGSDGSSSDGSGSDGSGSDGSGSDGSGSDGSGSGSDGSGSDGSGSDGSGSDGSGSDGSGSDGSGSDGSGSGGSGSGGSSSDGSGSGGSGSGGSSSSADDPASAFGAGDETLETMDDVSEDGVIEIPGSSNPEDGSGGAASGGLMC